MNKKELMALEKVFCAEIDCRLPFQSKSKIYEKLCDEGFLERCARTFGGRLPVIVQGYSLTHAGRFAYCSSCSEEESK